MNIDAVSALLKNLLGERWYEDCSADAISGKRNLLQLAIAKEVETAVVLETRKRLSEEAEKEADLVPGPCPCCGSTGVFIEPVLKPYTSERRMIRCGPCGTRITGTEEVSKLIEYWNNMGTLS